MNYNFILQTIIFLSLGGIVYFAARTLPRISEKENEAHSDRSVSLFSKLPLEKMDNLANSYLERFLRRIKLLVMKLDNFLSEKLNRFKKE